MVTAEPYRFVVEAIAGDEWEVRSIVPKGSNPETFDPTPRDMVAMADGMAYFMVGGLGFEEVWEDKIKELYPQLGIVDTSNGIVRDNGDPHLWTSPDNMAVIACNVFNAMCKMDSINAMNYRIRLSAFNNLLQRTDSIVKEKLQCAQGKSFLVFHPSLTYFAKRYGLRQLAIEHEGKEPSVAQMRSLIDSAKACGVKSVLVQAEFDVKNAEVIADEIAARVYSINPLSYNWHEQMLYIADVISENTQP